MIVDFLLVLIGASLAGLGLYGSYRLFRSSQVDDEIAERERTAEQAEKVKKYSSKKSPEEVLKDLETLEKFKATRTTRK